jgi:hypothetical protein
MKKYKEKNIQGSQQLTERKLGQDSAALTIRRGAVQSGRRREG